MIRESQWNLMGLACVLQQNLVIRVIPAVDHRGSSLSRALRPDDLTARTFAYDLRGVSIVIRSNARDNHT